MASRPTPYRRSLRPVQPESFPTYVDDELERLSNHFTQLLEYTQSLEARIAALEP